MTNNKEKITTSKTIKTILFAGLIAAMILPFGMPHVSAELISEDIVEERVWGQEKHEIFKAFTEHEMPDNKWNKQMLKENIKNYNIETKIGHDIDGYELVALDAQEQILQNKYDPSIAQEKLHEYVLSIYEVPETKNEIKDRIVEIVGQNNYWSCKAIG